MGTPEDVAAEQYFTRPKQYMTGRARRVSWGLIEKDAELPENPYDLSSANYYERLREQIYSKAQQDMKAAGWRKVVEEG